jgi:cell division protein FtsW
MQEINYDVDPTVGDAAQSVEVKAGTGIKLLETAKYIIGEIRRCDTGIAISAGILLLISIVEVFSASSTLTFKTGEWWKPITYHTLSIMGGIIIIFIVNSCPPKYLSTLILVVPVIFVLLIITKLFGKVINDSTRTIFGFQPSEWFKPCLVCTVAFFTSQLHSTGKDIFYRIILYLSVPVCVLITLDNVSTGLILFVVLGLMLLIGLPKAKLIRLLIVVASFGILFSAYIAVAPNVHLKKTPLKRFVTSKNRIFRKVNIREDYFAASLFGITPEKSTAVDDSPLGKYNYQETMAKIAVARGWPFGVFPGNSRQRDFLPQPYSDYIYAIIIEETGMFGCMIVFVMYVIILIRAGRIAFSCRFMFRKLLLIGCSMMIFIQAGMHMGVSVDWLPVTGQTLPLVSRGINSMLVSCMLIGIMLNISRKDKGIPVENPDGEDFNLNEIERKEVD